MQHFILVSQSNRQLKTFEVIFPDTYHPVADAMARAPELPWQHAVLHLSFWIAVTVHAALLSLLFR